MSKISHLPKTLPSKDLPFTVKLTGSITGHTYTGSFVVTVPDVKAMSRVGIELAKLNEGTDFELLDINTRVINNSIAYLKATLKEGPAWFVNPSDHPQEEGIDYGLKTMDLNVPIEIFRQADKLVKAWHASLKGQPKAE